MANYPCPKCNSCNIVIHCKIIKPKKKTKYNRECLDCGKVFKEK